MDVGRINFLGEPMESIIFLGNQHLEGDATSLRHFSLLMFSWKILFNNFGNIFQKPNGQIKKLEFRQSKILSELSSMSYKLLLVRFGGWEIDECL
jgi:hypothetical protein